MERRKTPIDAVAQLKVKRFEATALKYMDSIYRSALRMMGNETDAQDLVQETYLRAYRFFDGFREGVDCKAWLFAILKNTFINTINRDRKQPHMVLLSEIEKYGSDLSADADPEDEIFGDLFDDDITAAMDTLPDKYRHVVLLVDAGGCSYKEVADTIGCPMGTVMSRLHRGRRLLRDILRSRIDRFRGGL